MELRHVVLHSLVAIAETPELSGWVRSDEVSDPAPLIEQIKLLTAETNRLQANAKLSATPRARVAISIPGAPHCIAGQPYSTNVIVANVGHATARVRVEWSCEIVKAGSTSRCPFQRGKMAKHLEPLKRCEPDPRFFLRYALQSRIAATAKTNAAIEARTNRLYVHGTAAYSDDLGESARKSFCAFYLPNSSGDPWQTCQQHEDNEEYG